MDNSNVVVTQSTSKKTPVGLIIGIIVGILVLFIISIVLLVKFIFNSASKSYQGTWDCNSQLRLEIGNNNFDMYANDGSATINSTYKISEESHENNYHKYTIDASATKRIINGQKYTKPYTTQYQIIMEGTNRNQMVMMNTVTYSMYNCTRK